MKLGSAPARFTVKPMAPPAHPLLVTPTLRMRSSAGDKRLLPVLSRLYGGDCGQTAAEVSQMAEWGY